MILRNAIIVVVTLFSTAIAQYETSQDSIYSRMTVPKTELRWIMDTPTAGMLPRGAFDMDMRTFPTGGLQASLMIGLMDRFSVGFGYQAARALTDAVPEWGPRPEFLFRFRLHEETGGLPAIAVGFSSLGYGAWDKDRKRYMVKSKGFYLSFSKNFKLYSNPAGWHWGINYSFESKTDNDPSGFVGFNTDLGDEMTFLAEYDLGINDNKPDSIYGLGRGFLNLGIVWYITDELSLELDLKDLLKNRRHTEAIDREARLVLVEYFY